MTTHSVEPHAGYQVHVGRGSAGFWLGLALVVLLAAAAAFAVGFLMSAEEAAPVPQYSNASEIIQAEIDKSLALLKAEPSSVDIVQQEIARSAALLRLESGPSSVELVEAAILEAAIDRLDTGPSSVELVEAEIAAALAGLEGE